MTRPLVVDLCHTLVKENTTRGYVNHVRKPPLRSLVAWAGATRLAARLESAIERDVARRLLIASLGGRSRDELYRQATDYVGELLAERADSRVLEAIHRSLAANAPVYLATASLDPVASAVVDTLGLSGSVSSRLAYDASGNCEGRLAWDGSGRKWEAFVARGLGPALDSMELYTDNLEDVDLMTRADRIYFLGPAHGLPRSLRSSERLEVWPNK